MTYSQVGLMFDMIGVVFVFLFGLPSGFVENPNQHATMIIETAPSEEEVKNINRRNTFISWMAWSGLAIIFFGFLLQLLGSSRN